MLSTPKYGWATIKIGDWHDRCSYLDDVPLLLLDCFEAITRENKPAAIKFDAEGYEYTIVFDWMYAHIITDCFENVGFTYTSIKIDVVDLAKELVNDIKNNIDEWVDFVPLDLSDEERELRKNKLLCLCDFIERRIRNVHT